MIFPNFLTPAECEPLRQTCDRILDQIRSEHPDHETTNIATLTELKYFGDRKSELLTLLEFIADPRILSILEAIADQPILFHNTQYFPNPQRQSWQGAWHRDTQFGAATDAIEQHRIESMTGVHFRVAFVADDCLEYIPGSEQRWDTETELGIRKGDNPTQIDIPGRIRIALKPGDACLFHAWGIHRGSYRAAIPRQTLDVIYGWGGRCEWAIPDPTCFSNVAIVSELNNIAQLFYQRFITTYSLMHPG